jgi:hypothetical protein
LSDDVDAMFGGRRPSFTDRLTRGQFPGPQENAPPTAATNPIELAPDDGAYKPYGFLPANTVGEVCEVRGWVPGTDVPQGIVFQYRFLMQVGFVGDEMLKLMLPDCIVVIEGKHLTDLRHKLSRRMVTFIQQYHGGRWPSSPNGNALVERIEVLRPDYGQRRN